jgi:tRNA nucleotidyltransferase (CCA-adding enzyme)
VTTSLQIIIPHSNTDLDALGAAVGVQVLYPGATIVLPGPPGQLAAAFLSLHRYTIRTRYARDIDLTSVKRAIVVDTADPARLGPLQAVLPHAEIHVYDHHPPEADDLPATLEVRDIVGAASTLVAELIAEAGAPLTPVQATAMLLGIYADTGSLNHLGTTARDAAAAAFLLAKGANLQAVARFIPARLSPPQQALLRTLQDQGRWVTVNGARIRLVEAETADYVGGLSLIVHTLLTIAPAHALFAAVKMADRVHLVGRSEVPWVNVATVCAAFGGGGHHSAAAAVAKGATVAAVCEKLVQTLEQVVERPLMARDVMSSPVKTIMQSKPVRDAERLMLRYGHSGLPVLDELGHLAGMVSLRDIEKARRHGHEQIPVKGMMIRHVVTVGPDTPLDEVQDLMLAKDIGRIPVVEGANLLGIVSRSDLLEHVYGGPVPGRHRTLYAAPGLSETLPESDPAVGVLQEAVAATSPGLRGLLRQAGAVAERLGVSVYAVGGFVRDLLMGRPNLDLDIVAEGDGLAYARALAEALGADIQEVPRFETAHIYLPAPEPDVPARIDVATARREFYEHAAALPVVEHADLRQDLYRRDFSINAMAVPLGASGPLGLVDFFGGWQDLQDGLVRILHTLSFVEDPTRILRAVRFANRYGFSLEAETLTCARQAVDDGLLDQVSVERLRNELMLILQEPGSGGTIATLHDLGVLERLLPGVAPGAALRERLDGVDGLATALPDLYQEATGWLAKLMILLLDLQLTQGLKAARRLKLRREFILPVQEVLTNWRIAVDVCGNPRSSRLELVRTLHGWPPDGLLVLCLLGYEERVLRYWREWRHMRLAITGADLTASAVTAGPRIKQTLERVLADYLDGLAPDRDTQLSLALRYAREEA